MPLETASYINQLDAANPLGSDPIASGDDHIRLIKAAIKATFPNIAGPVTVTQADLNTKVTGAVQKTGDTMTGALVLSGNASADLQAVPKQQLDAVIASLGTLSSQNASAVALTGGTMNGVTVGGTTAAPVTGTTVTANTSFVVGPWSITSESGKLVFRHNNVIRGSLDASGNFAVTGNVTGFGAP